MLEQTLDEYRGDFGKKVFPQDLKTAGELMIPNHWLFRASLSDEEKDRIIETGRSILQAFPSWVFVRISWCHFFFLSKETPKEIEEIVQAKVAIITPTVPHVRWWQLFSLSLEDKGFVDEVLLRTVEEDLGALEKEINLMVAPDPLVGGLSMTGKNQE